MTGRRIITWLLIALGALGAVAAVVSIGRAGIGWDAPVDARALVEVRAIPADATLSVAYESVQSTSEFYGILIPQLAEAAHRLVTGSVNPLEPWNLATYRWQSGVTVVLAIGSAAALGAAVTVALRSRVAGAFTWALIMTTPLFVGMSHVNFKDMPVAAGMSLVSAGLMLAYSARSTAVRWLAGTILMALGSIVTLGTRPGAWPLLLGLTVGSWVIFALICLRTRSVEQLAPTGIGAVVGIAASLVFLVATNPFARIDLLAWLWDAFAVMRQYPWDGVTRAAGQDFDATDLPWWYVPGWLAAQLPVLTTLAAVWALVATGASVAGARWSIPRRSLVGMAPAGIQGVVLPVVIVLGGSVLYDGLRHVLFIIPALVALIAIGVAAIDVARWPRPRWHAAATALVALGVVGASLFATVRWIPYSYAFINPAVGWASSERSWELDYWGVSAIEGVRLLQEQGFASVAVEPTLMTSDMVGGVWRDQAREQAPDGYGLYVFHRGDTSIGACEPLFTISRDGQVIGEGARCTKWDG